MKLTIESVGNDDADGDIDTFLSRASGSMVHYTPAYRNFLVECLNDCVPLTLVAREGERIVGLLPAFVRKNAEYGDILNSLPFFGSHGGAIADESVSHDQITNALYGALADVIRQGKFASFTIVENLFRPMTDENARILDCAPVDDRIGQYTMLPARSSDPGNGLFKMFHQKTRNSIRKGQQIGLRFAEQNDAKSLAWLQSVHESSMQSLGGIAKPLSFFESLTRCMGFGKSARLFLAYDGSDAVAGVLCLTHGKTVEYFTPVVVPAFRDRQALSALIFHCMSEFAREGLEIWNWGGTWRSQEGVYRFKERWGAEQRIYRYFGKLLNQSLSERDPAWLVANFPWFYLFPFKS